MDCFTAGVGGCEVEYAEEGAGEPLVLLHGWGATKRIWRHLWPQVVTRCRSMAPDLPGWGGSDKPDAPYTPEWYADWLGAFLDARGAPAANVVAHSMGSMAAALFAARHPDRVLRLVLANPPIDGATAFSRRTYVLSRPGLSAAAWLFARLRAVRRWIARDFTHVLPWDDSDIDGIARGTAASTARSVRGMIGTDLRQVFPSVRARVLLVSSTHDRVVQDGQAELAAQALPLRHAVIRECGHCPMLERPEEFNAAVVGFLCEGRVPTRPLGW